MWIALIVCSTLLAAYALQAWTSWLRWRHQARIDSVEGLLPLTADTPEYVLSAVEALADLGPGYFSRERVRHQVLKVRIDQIEAIIDECAEGWETKVAQAMRRLP